MIYTKTHTTLANIPRYYVQRKIIPKPVHENELNVNVCLKSCCHIAFWPTVITGLPNTFRIHKYMYANLGLLGEPSGKFICFLDVYLDKHALQERLPTRTDRLPSRTSSYNK